MKGPIYLAFPKLINIELRGDFEYDPKEVETLAKTYLPGVEIGDKMETGLLVEQVESPERRLAKTQERYTIFDNWNGKISLDVWHFLYSLLRLELLKNTLYPVHSACAGLNKNVLLVGHSGSGKSTVLLKLLNDYGWNIFSGNKTVVSVGQSGIEAVTGTKSMSLRTADTGKFPNLLAEKIDYQNRSAFILDEKHYSKEKNVAISYIYIVRLNDGWNECEELTYPSNMHVLYPYFLDAVNADTIMCDGEDVLVGTPPKNCQSVLAKNLKSALSTVKVFKISGTLDFISKTIAEK